MWKTYRGNQVLGMVCVETETEMAIYEANYHFKTAKILYLYMFRNFNILLYHWCSEYPRLLLPCQKHCFSTHRYALTVSCMSCLQIQHFRIMVAHCWHVTT